MITTTSSPSTFVQFLNIKQSISAWAGQSDNQVNPVHTKHISYYALEFKHHKFCTMLFLCRNSAITLANLTHQRFDYRG